MKGYFGLREIGVAKLPGLGHPYVALNGSPVYLQLTLDQGFHPDGFTTWPSDAAMREEVLIARRLGLNAIRTHVKVEPPRKLYWADRLGVLVMSDVPNSWGEPDAAMRQEWETALRGMLRRDFNHPAIFSWVLFNEQWGLLTQGSDGKKAVLPETQAWLETRYELAKSLDPTRLVEDNSPCCGGGHVRTDLNSWHVYLPGWKWKAELDQAEAQAAPGSSWNYLGGRKQRGEPMLNSECGNVWGYEGSTGDVDWSFDYHAMIDEFRRHPKTAGWLYTEHYRLAWPKDVRAEDVLGASFVAELGAKQLFGKDRIDKGRLQGDFMLGGGTHDPGLNPNAYPMTDGVRHPSAVRILVNGIALGSFELPDDPADHRGLLSWHAQKRDGRLDEAGSYGTLVTATLPAQALQAAAAAGELRVRLEVDEALPGGLAVYGEDAGRYPVDLSIVLTLGR